MPKPPKRPRDIMQLAKLVGEVATGEARKPEESSTQPKKAPRAKTPKRAK